MNKKIFVTILFLTAVGCKTRNYGSEAEGGAVYLENGKALEKVTGTTLDEMSHSDDIVPVYLYRITTKGFKKGETYETQSYVLSIMTKSSLLKQNNLFTPEAQKKLESGGIPVTLRTETEEYKDTWYMLISNYRAIGGFSKKGIVLCMAGECDYSADVVTKTLRIIKYK